DAAVEEKWQVGLAAGDAEEEEEQHEPTDGHLGIIALSSGKAGAGRQAAIYRKPGPLRACRRSRLARGGQRAVPTTRLAMLARGRTSSRSKPLCSKRRAKSSRLRSRPSWQATIMCTSTSAPR